MLLKQQRDVKPPNIEVMGLKKIRRRRKKKVKLSRFISHSNISTGSDIESLNTGVSNSNGIIRNKPLDEESTLTGSGEDEQDAFLTRKNEDLA